jgi:hypothetical protein
MGQYVVSHVGADDTLAMAIVEADNPIVAIIEGVREITEAGEDDPWLNSFLYAEYAPASYAEDLAEDLADITAAFYFYDELVAVMPIH